MSRRKILNFGSLRPQLSQESFGLDFREYFSMEKVGQGWSPLIPGGISLWRWPWIPSWKSFFQPKPFPGSNNPIQEKEEEESEFQGIPAFLGLGTGLGELQKCLAEFHVKIPCGKGGNSQGFQGRDKNPLWIF